MLIPPLPPANLPPAVLQDGEGAGEGRGGIRS